MGSTSIAATPVSAVVHRHSTLVWVLAAAILAAAAPLGAADWAQAVTTAPLPEGWRITDEPQTAEGTALFTLINGGAELYMRHGFEKALLATCSSRQGKTVELEIYEMKDRAAALAVQVEKSGGRGKPLALGDRALLADYYINFIRGRFQVSLSGHDAATDTVAALEGVARAMDAVLVPHIR